MIPVSVQHMSAILSSSVTTDRNMIFVWTGDCRSRLHLNTKKGKICICKLYLKEKFNCEMHETEPDIYNVTSAVIMFII